MAKGRTFQESFQKALRSLETGLDGWSLPSNWVRLEGAALERAMRVPNPERMLALRQAMEDGYTNAQLFELTAIDPWFLSQFRGLHETEAWLRGCDGGLSDLTAGDWSEVKKQGFSDPQIAAALSRASGKTISALDVRSARKTAGVVPSFRRVDTCAAEFEAETPYM